MSLSIFFPTNFSLKVHKSHQEYERNLSGRLLLGYYLLGVNDKTSNVNTEDVIVL